VLDLGVFSFRLRLAPCALRNAHATQRSYAAILSSTCLPPTRPDVQPALVSREVLGKVAVELQKQTEQAVTDFAFGRCARGGRLLV
jgi:hypothetical protein